MERSAEVLVVAHELYARSGSSSSSSTRPPIYKVVGIILAICSGLFIGVSFVLKKTGLLKANVKYNEEAGEGYGYLKNAFWWTGMTLMIIGEICNFVAYAFVDAILVTPLGALSVVVTAILSAIFLKERLSFVGKVGCFNCIVGSVVIVINAPEHSAVADIQEMKDMVITPGFLSYAGVVIVGCAIVAFWVAPKYGKKSMMVYLTICSLIGGLSVVATQGLGSAIVAQAGGEAQFNQWFLYVLLVFVIATLLTEIIFLNKALNLFNAALVTPTYYVYFTSATIVTSAILFQGFSGTSTQIATVIMGFLQICSGVVLLQLSKSAKDVPDTAVFKGDLDQVRTVAEQEEPEYEPRADTIRGGGAILRSLSRARTIREAKEVERIKEEHMQPIGEDEQVEFDGLRRRRTVLGPGQSSSPLQRRKTIHPPLGMSHFPEEDDTDKSDDDSDIHPGFFSKLSFRRKHLTVATEPSAPMPLTGMSSAQEAGDSRPTRSNENLHPHVYGLPPGLQRDMQEDTSYKPVSTTAIHWAENVDEDRPKSKGNLAPKAPPHTAKRQFSFQNVFHRNRASSGASSSGSRPPSRPAPLSFHSRKSSKENSNQAGDGTTEEERLGLVKGDSSNMLNLPSYSSPPQYSDVEEEDWQQITPAPSRSPEPPRPPPHRQSYDPQSEFQPPTTRRVETDMTDDYDEMKAKEAESKSGGGGAFI